MSLYLAIDAQAYRVVQLARNEHHRGGLILIIRRTIQLETAELLRPEDNTTFFQGIIMEDREGRALAFWYGAPTLGNTEFEATLTQLLTEYNIRFLTGDFNSRHPTWCKKHDEKKRNDTATNNKSATWIPSARHYKTKIPGTKEQEVRGLRSSTIDLVVAKSEIIENLKRVEGAMALGSDHFPILFTARIEVGREEIQRRIPKTLLQSYRMREAEGLIYKVTLNEVGTALSKVTETPTDEAEERSLQQEYERAQGALKEPWGSQVRRRRRKSGSHVNGELIRLWSQKKKLYEKWRWKPTTQNKKAYNSACHRTQRREM